MKPIKKYLVSLFVVFLHYAPQIRGLSVEWNRFFYYWDHRAAVGIILGSILASLLAWGLSLAACRLRPGIIRRLFDQLFLLALASGLLACGGRLFVEHPVVPKACWLAVLLVVGYSFVRAQSKLVHYAAVVCLIFSPLAPICFVQMFTWSTWGRPADHWPMVRKAEASGTPVFVFVFDEWSYDRSTRNGEFHCWFKNLGGLCQQSVVFKRPRSPGNSTDISIPRIMFQTDKLFVIKNGNTHWVVDHGNTDSYDDNAAVITSKVPSLFDLSREHGYTSVLIGYHLPYRVILNGQVDYCLAYPYYPRGQGLLQETALGAYVNVMYWTDPFSKWVWRKTYPRVYSKHWLAVNQQVRREVMKVIKTCPGKTFAFIHWPLPHAPFIFNPDGSYRGPFKDDRMAGTPADYQRNLMFLDLLIGQLVAELKASGKFDRSLIILTSDHSWHREPEPAFRQGPDRERKVPLIIKLPGQESGCVIHETFCTNRLGPLFQAVFAGQCDTQKLVELLQEMVASEESQSG